MMASNQGTIAISSWDGTLSGSEFYTTARTFRDQWNNFNSAFPQWSWVRCPKQPWAVGSQVDVYLSMENVILPVASEECEQDDDHTGNKEQTSDDNDQFIDSAILVQQHVDERHHYDLHVVYSTSYKVPVLFFRAYCSGGQPLVLDDIVKDFPGNYAKELIQSKWTFITQEEHPYMKRPWYTIHPCGTSEWMKLLFTESCPMPRGVVVEKYMLSWFSVVGQVFGLKMPFEMLGSLGLQPSNVVHRTHSLS